MKPHGRLRLIIAAVLFVAWLGWLTYLAATATHPVVLSRPQLLVASAEVVARVAGDADHPSGKVTIVRVLHAPGQDDKLKADQELEVDRLADCGPEQGWHGPGEYLLPLSQTSEGYAVTLTPTSPGFDPASQFESIRLRIYPATSQVLQQFKNLMGEQQ